MGTSAFEDRVRSIGSDKVRRFSEEQLAGLVLLLLQEVAAGKLKPNTASDHSLSAILGYWIAPLWRGRDALDGFPNEGGMCTSIGPMEAPPELKTRFLDATALLYGKQLVRRIHGENSDDLVELTQKGKDARVLASFELTIERAPQEIIERCSGAVFRLIAGSSAGDPVGTAFLTENGHIVTCKHCVDNAQFTLRIGDADLNGTYFSVDKHPSRDLAILTFRSDTMASVLAGIQHIPLAPELSQARVGEAVIALGHPYVPGTDTRLLPISGMFQGHVTIHGGESLLSFSCNLTGGFSGGPMVTLEGNLVAVACQTTEEASDTTGSKPGANVHGFGIPCSAVRDMMQTAPAGREDQRRCPSCGHVSLSSGEAVIIEQRKSGSQPVLVPTTYCYLCNWEELHWDRAWQPWRPATDD